MGRPRKIGHNQVIRKIKDCDCKNCPYPACVEDGYHPGISPRYYRKRCWSRGDILKLKSLHTIYDTDLLANIFLTPEEDVIAKLEEINVQAISVELRRK